MRCATKEDNVLSFTTDAAGGAATLRAPVMVPISESVTSAAIQADSEAQLKRALSSLSDDKAEDVVQIDLRGKSAIGDYMVICSGRSSRQVTAIAENLVRRLKQNPGVSARTEGKDSADWVLIDTGDVIVHVFRPEMREFYQLEKMWLPAGESAAQAGQFPG